MYCYVQNIIVYDIHFPHLEMYTECYTPVCGPPFFSCAILWVYQTRNHQQLTNILYVAASVFQENQRVYLYRTAKSHCSNLFLNENK